MEELDTISDLVHYLADREDFLANSLGGTLITNEADLLAVYVMNVRSFAPLLEKERHLTILTEVWDRFVASPEYAARAVANVQSYVWDRLIDQLYEDHLTDNMEFGGDLDSIENRTERRAVSEKFVNFMADASLRSRMVMSSSGTTHVFLKALIQKSEQRSRELQLRAFIDETKCTSMAVSDK